MTAALDRVRDLRRDVGVDRRLIALPTDEREKAAVLRRGRPDVAAGPVVPGDEDHDRVVLGRPSDQHAVLPVQVPAADVIDHPPESR